MTTQQKPAPADRLAVAVIDTGVTHAQLPCGCISAGIDLTGEAPDVGMSDDNGHGTLIAKSIVRANPHARIIPIKLMGKFGYPRAPDQLEIAFEWALEHHDQRGIGVVCAPFADRSHVTTDDAFRGTRLQQLVADLRAVRVPVVAPAGNWFRQNRRWSPQGMAWPAILREVVSVGALRRGEDGLNVADTSQRLHSCDGGPCRTTVFAEPDAPGGTSGAAALVAASLLALRAAHPHASVDVLLAELLRHGSTVRDDDSALHWPAIDRAYIVALSTAPPSARWKGT